MSTFADLGVPAPLVAALDRAGITEPFPIQAATLRDALAGHDVSGKAPTGSGKTLAFGLAVLTRVGQAESRRPRALILVPTRELAAQVRRELMPLAKALRRTVVSVYGGAGYEPQKKFLRQGADVVVACPGRLEDMIQRGDARLDDVSIVVVDEADRMADMGFLPAVKRLLDRTHDDRQTLLFSATLDGEVDALVKRYQHNPRRHDVAAAEDDGYVEHLFWRADRHDRVPLAADLIAHHDRAIVFCRTKHGADRVARQLSQAGVDAVAIHGDRSQSQRERALAAFISGKAQALVATDVAARGIHVDQVPCVVHFDPPDDPKDYLHRSGRTGRAGFGGIVVSLVEPAKVKLVGQLQRSLDLPSGFSSPDIPTRPPRAAADVARDLAGPADEPTRRGPKPGRGPRKNNGSSKSTKRSDGWSPRPRAQGDRPGATGAPKRKRHRGQAVPNARSGAAKTGAKPRTAGSRPGRPSGRPAGSRRRSR